MQFIQSALKGKPESTMPQPPGIMNIRIDPATGNPVSPESKKGILFISYLPGIIAMNFIRK